MGISGGPLGGICNSPSLIPHLGQDLEEESHRTAGLKRPLQVGEQLCPKKPRVIAQDVSSGGATTPIEADEASWVIPQKVSAGGAKTPKAPDFGSVAQKVNAEGAKPPRHPT